MIDLNHHHTSECHNSIIEKALLRSCVRESNQTGLEESDHRIEGIFDSHQEMIMKGHPGDIIKSFNFFAFLGARSSDKIGRRFELGKNRSKP
jgi:hypothetical protein